MKDLPGQARGRPRMRNGRWECNPIRPFEVQQVATCCHVQTHF